MTNEPITLSNLKDQPEVEVLSTIPNEITPVVDATEIRPAAIAKDPLEVTFGEAFNNLDAALIKKGEEMDIRREAIIEEISDTQEVSAVEKNDIDDDEKESEYKNSGSSIFAIKENDIDEDEDEEKQSEDDKQLNDVKSVIKERIKPVTNVIDLTSFSISKKPVSLLNSLKESMSHKKTVNWGLFATGVPITMESFSGLEIQKLDPNSSSKNRFNTYTEIYTNLYNHILDTNKPKSMEEWVKLINFFDINHIYFTAYKASFDGSNSIPYSCPKCNEIFMKDMEIDTMVKYKDDNAKELFKRVFEKDNCDVEKYEVELVQISDDYVFGLREPSIYNVVFENVILDEKFTEKYSELLSLLTYVDCIYYINREDNSLQPIALEEYPNNATKTIKTKIKKYAQIVEALSSDQFYVFNSFIKAINTRHDEIVYILPECSCPKCNAIIPEQEMNAETLLFTRHQLAGIANT